MAELAAFQIGQSVELQDGRLATVRFVGSTHFAVGDWVGVELEAATGKNDGAVQGKRYFDCKPGYGMFVRPAVAEILDQPTPKANGKLPAKADGPATKPRPPSGVAAGLKRQSVLETGVSKRQSVNAGSPTPKAKLAAGSRMSTVRFPMAPTINVLMLMLPIVVKETVLLLWVHNLVRKLDTKPSCHFYRREAVGSRGQIAAEHAQSGCKGFEKRSQ